MKDKLKKAGIAIGVLTIFLLFLVCNDYIGVPKQFIEKEARSSQKIFESHKVSKAETEKIVGLLFSDGCYGKHTFSIYVNRSGFSFGYFFRGGGSISKISHGVARINIQGYDECVYMSMNKQKVNRVEVDNGQAVEIMEIDSTKPFVFILPINAGIVKIYDVDGNIIESVGENI